MEYNQKALGLRISKYREIRNLSQKQLSNICGVSQSYIASIEIGVGKTVNMAKLANIADALNVSIDDLLCDSINKSFKQDINKGKDKNIKIKTDILNEISTFSNKEIIQFNKILQSFIKYNNQNTNK